MKRQHNIPITEMTSNDFYQTSGVGDEEYVELDVALATNLETRYGNLPEENKYIKLDRLVRTPAFCPHLCC